jgi:hypothetical protein
MTTNISKKRKFVADGVFYAELNEVRLVGWLSRSQPVCLIRVPLQPPALPNT